MALQDLEVALTRLISASRRYLAERAASVLEGMRPSELAVLVAVSSVSPASVTHIAATLEIDRATSSRVLRKLHAAELVERAPALADKRSVLVRVSPLGRSRLAQARNLATARLRNLLSDHTTEDLNIHLQMMRSLTRA